MSGFAKYQHIERIGTLATEGITAGTCFIFPKIDGTNASLWFDGQALCAGSRNRELTLEHDNHGFLAHALDSEQLSKYGAFFDRYQGWRLYGEWLVPHSLKTYRDDAWRKFYVFDVVKETEDLPIYTPYADYAPMLERFGIDYIPAIAEAVNPTQEYLEKQLEANTFLIKDGEGFGEGVVVKNYGFINRFGRTVWGKIVRNEFKEKHGREMGHVKQQVESVEDRVVEKFLTDEFIRKEHAKLLGEDGGWDNRMVPRLLSTVWLTFVDEEMREVVKTLKNPTIDFSRLHFLVLARVKKALTEVFNG
jgi:hypothetical protein